METIHSLRRKGYKVRVLHSRHVSTMCGNEPELKGVIKELIRHIYPKGGITQIDVTTPDGKTVTGIAKCSQHDTWNRKLGNNIALGRALKQLTITKKKKCICDNEVTHKSCPIHSPFNLGQNNHLRIDNWENEGGSQPTGKYINQ